MDFFCINSQTIKDIYCIFEVKSSRLNLDNELDDSICSLKLGPRYAGEKCPYCHCTDCYCFHFAYIILPEPILLQHFQSNLKKALSNLCLDCKAHRQLCQCSKKGKFTNKIAFQKKNTTTSQRKYLVNECEINEAIYTAKELHTLLTQVKHWPNETHPQCYLSDIVVVLPNCDRPWTRDGSNILKAHTWTKTYHDIFELTKRYKNALTNSDERAHILENIYFKVNGILKESSQIPSKYYSSFGNRGGNDNKTILGSIGGVNKSGILRGYILGKNVSRCGRAVAAPNASLLPGEVELPYYLCRTVTHDEQVTSLNYNRLQHIILTNQASLLITNKDKRKKIVMPNNCKQLSKQLQIGDIVSRYLQNGDIVILNRQPTLHTGSMMAYTLKIGPKLSVVRINPCTGKGFNADYDGDEFNIHIPKSAACSAEIDSLMHVKNMILDDNGKVQVALMETSLVGISILTQPGFQLSKYDYMQYLQGLPGNNKETYEGWELIRDLFNPYVLFPEEGIINHDGKIIGGPLNSKHFGYNGSIIRTLAIVYPDKCCYILHQLQMIGEEICLRYGLTVGINECKSFPITYNENAKNQCSELCLSEKNNGFTIMSQAGSKGNILAIAPIRSMLGKQTYNGKDIPKFLGNTRVLPTIVESSSSLLNEGIVTGNLYKGLDPSSSALSQFIAREGITMRSVMTKLSGMFSRILSYSFGVYKIHYDNTVRDNNNIITQFRFGEDGIDPKYSLFVKGNEYTHLTFTSQFKYRIDPSKYMISPSSAVGLLTAQHMSRLVVQATMDTMHQQNKKSNSPYLRQLIEDKLSKELIEIKLKVPSPRQTWLRLCSKEECIIEHNTNVPSSWWWWESLCDQVTGCSLFKRESIVYLNKQKLIDVGFKGSIEIIQPLLEQGIRVRISPWEYSSTTIICIFETKENIKQYFKSSHSIRIEDENHVVLQSNCGIWKAWEIIPECDKVNTTSNDARDMENVFGMSSARNCLYDALSKVDAIQGNIDHRYISFLSDVITYKGTLCFVNINGLKATNPGAFVEASFRDPVSSFKRACSNNTKDHADSLYKNISIGENIPFGTGQDCFIQETSQDYYYCTPQSPTYS